MFKAIRILSALSAVLLFSAFATAGVRATDAELVKKQTLDLFKTFKNKNWIHLYDQVQFSPAVEKQLTTAEDFAKDVAAGIQSSDPDDNLSKLFANMSEVEVGAAVIEGTRAHVATTCKISMPGQAPLVLLGVATLVKVGDVWKWDLSFSDDAEQATAARMTELLGEVGVSN